jgi:hypothetical protein
MIMKLIKSLIIAMLVSATMWAQGPTNQVISNTKALVNSAGQPAAAVPAQPTGKPSATTAKPVAVTPKPAVKAAAPASSAVKAAAPASSAAKAAAPASSAAKAAAPASSATKAAAPASSAAKQPATNPKPATSKPASVNAKPAAPAAATPTMATKPAPGATKALAHAAPASKPSVAETKKPTVAAHKPVAKEQPKPQAKHEDNPAVAKPASAKEATASRVSSMAGKRDPFVSPIVRASAGGPVCETGKRCLMVDQIQLKGIVKSPSGFIAVVENPLKRAYFLRENDPVFNGSVIKITGDTVVFREATTDKLGKQGMREVVKKVNAPVV